MTTKKYDSNDAMRILTSIAEQVRAIGKKHPGTVLIICDRDSEFAVAFANSRLRGSEYAAADIQIGPEADHSFYPTLWKPGFLDALVEEGTLGAFHAEWIAENLDDEEFMPFILVNKLGIWEVLATTRRGAVRITKQVIRD